MATNHDGQSGCWGSASRPTAIASVALVLAVAGCLSAQPGEWGDLPFAATAQPGGHIAWVGDSIYYFGSGSSASVYDQATNMWVTSSFMNVDTGAATTWNGYGYVYLLRGSRYGREFWRITTSNHGIWRAADIPEQVGVGAAICQQDNAHIVAFPGRGSARFYRYTFASNTWSELSTLPAVPGFGACMSTVGSDTVCALKGGGTRDFWEYVVGGNWTTKPPAPVPVGAGATLAWNGQAGSQSKLLLVPGGGSHGLWSYDVSSGVWESLPSSPHPVGGATEGTLAAFDRRADRQHLYSLQGTSGSWFRRYGSRVASTLPFDESFEGSFFPPNSWKVDWPLVTRRTSSTYPTAIPYSGNWMAVFALRGYPGHWTGLRTPPFAVGPSPRLFKVSFRMYQSPDGDTGDTLYVGQSLTPTGYNFVAAFPRYASTAGWNAKTVTLETLGADTLYAVFYAHSGTVGNYNIYMDSLRVWQPSTWQDVCVSGVLAPDDTVAEGTMVTPSAVVRNNGTSSASFMAKFRIGSVYADSQQVSSLAPNDSATLVFNSWIAARGSFVAKCSTAMAGDEDPLNDAATSSVFVSAYDVAAVRVVTPSGSAPFDSGTTVSPQLMVRNAGNIATPVTAVFRVGGFYSDTNTLANLNPGDSNTIWFRPWEIRERGTHVIRCSTLVTGDRNSVNDTCSGTVAVRVRDVTPTRIVVPADTVDSGAIVTPQAVVRNCGTTPETFAVRLAIGSFYANNQNVSDLAPGDSALVSFVNWQATQMGSHATRCSTLLVGDMDPSNNSVDDSVTVAVRTRDVGVLRVVAPTGAVDSGAAVIPEARVRNFGNVRASFPVVLRIGASFADTQSVADLDPSDSVTVAFRSWVATQRGRHAVKCTTALAGDVNPGNNSRTDTVMVQVQDVGCTRLIAPVGVVDSGTVITPVCSTFNYGTDSETYDVRMKIGTGYNQTASVPSHSPGTRLYVTFPTYTVTQRTTIAVACSTELTADVDPDNDKQEGTVRARVLDVAALAILAPTDSVDSGTVCVPAATVANNGSETAVFSAMMRIGTWSRTISDTLAPGTLDTVTFSPCSLDVVGAIATCCSTSLIGDLVPDNNAVRGTVFVRSSPVGMGGGETALALPAESGMYGIHPSPVVDRVTMSYGVGSDGRCFLGVYDIRGALVRRLVDRLLRAGAYRTPWDRRDQQGRRVATGVYFCRMVVDGFRDSRKLLLVE